MVQPLDKDLMANQFDAPIPRGLTATTHNLDESMAYGRSDGATTQANVLDTIQESWHWGLDDAMDEYYDDEVSDKATMQIER